MNEAILRMLNRYDCRSVDDTSRALREIMQELALLGLWRSRFFEKAAFYGGTALRILYGLDRFSEDLDFSLLSPDPVFELGRHGSSLERELRAFGFDVDLTVKEKKRESPILSAFLKANTLEHILLVRADEAPRLPIPRDQVMKIRIEVDRDPPPDFSTESRFILHPIPFSVRTFTLPDLFAGKMHALLCRQWKNRVKGRDWYDLVWYVANHPRLHLDHLAQRMIQSGHLDAGELMTPDTVQTMASDVIDRLDVRQARREVEPFVRDPASLAVWSREFFQDLVQRIEFI